MHSPFQKLSCLALLTFVLLTATTTTKAYLPNPILYLSHIEYVTISGKEFVRYYYDIENKSAYPAELFASAPGLPPCGNNTNASRTWVDLYDQRGKRLNGFCALGSPSQLNDIWFALESSVVPPSWIYVEFTDRQTNTKYKSNLAETAL
jgi:hypothetical protein